MSISIFTQKGTVSASADPQLLADLGLDAVLRQLENSSENKAIRRYFTSPARDGEELAFRAHVYHDLQTPALRQVFDGFLARYEAMEECLRNRDIQSFEPGKHKWKLDGLVLFCRAVLGLRDGLAGAAYEAEGLKRLHRYTEAYCATEEFCGLQEAVRDCASYLDRAVHQIALDTDRYTIKISRPDGGQALCGLLRERLAKYRCKALDSEITALQGVQLRALELGMLEGVVRLYPETLTRLARFYAGYGDFMDSHFGGLRDELVFYRAYAGFCGRLARSGLAMSPVAVGGEEGIHLRDLYDLTLALESPDARPAAGAVCAYDVALEAAICIVAGDNQSGKTTLLRALGQAVYLSRLGLPAPCSSGKMKRVHALFSHFARDEDVKNNYGRLKEELVRIKDILDGAEEGSLLLLNDLFESTTTLDAVEISGEIFGRLREQGCACVFVTHIDALAEESWDGAVLTTCAAPCGDGTRYGVVDGAARSTGRHSASILAKYGLTYDDIAGGIA